MIRHFFLYFIRHTIWLVRYSFGMFVVCSCWTCVQHGHDIPTAYPCFLAAMYPVKDLIVPSLILNFTKKRPMLHMSPSAVVYE